MWGVVHCVPIVTFVTPPSSASMTLRDVRFPPLQGSAISSLLRKRLANRSQPGSSVSLVSDVGRQSRRREAKAVISAALLVGAAEEAILRQRRVLEALDKTQGELTPMPTSVIKRRLDVEANLVALRSIISEVEGLLDIGGGDMQALRDIKGKLEDLGFIHLVDRGEESWTQKRLIEDKEGGKREFGRPSSFTGLVLTSPLGVPVLVGREGAHADEVLRRTAQGTDLWFQVEDYSGSRVLLRTSLVRRVKGSRSCMQFAADVAAYFSSYRKWSSVPVMYTDSRKVAKRGSKMGQMRKRKSLGRMFGNPKDVIEEIAGKEPR